MSNNSTTTYPIDIGLAAAVAVLSLGLLLACVWIACLKCINSNGHITPSEKSSTYRNSNTKVAPRTIRPQQIRSDASSLSSPLPSPTSTNSIGTIDEETEVPPLKSAPLNSVKLNSICTIDQPAPEVLPRIVSLKDRQKALVSESSIKQLVAEDNKVKDKKTIIKRMESVMEDAERIELAHQAAKKRSLQATAQRKRSREDLRESLNENPFGASDSFVQKDK